MEVPRILRVLSKYPNGWFGQYRRTHLLHDRASVKNLLFVLWLREIQHGRRECLLDVLGHVSRVDATDVDGHSVDQRVHSRRVHLEPNAVLLAARRTKVAVNFEELVAQRQGSSGGGEFLLGARSDLFGKSLEVLGVHVGVWFEGEGGWKSSRVLRSGSAVAEVELKQGLFISLLAKAPRACFLLQKWPCCVY